MRQYNLIEQLRDIIIEEDLVDAIYLSGDFAGNSFSNASIVLFNVVVSKEKYNLFYERRLYYLSTYSYILFYDKTGLTEITCIYENGLILKLIIHFDYVSSDAILALYDKYSKLKDIVVENYEYSPSEIGEEISAFCLISIDYYFIYNEGEYLESFRNATRIFEIYTKICRYESNDGFAKMGIEDFYKSGIELFSKEEIRKFNEIISKMNIESQLEAVKRMFINIDVIINNFSILLVEHVNFDFYLFTKKLIMSIA